jgi:hypothetical protein
VDGSRSRRAVSEVHVVLALILVVVVLVVVAFVVAPLLAGAVLALVRLFRGRAEPDDEL